MNRRGNRGIPWLFLLLLYPSLAQGRVYEQEVLEEAEPEMLGIAFSARAGMRFPLGMEAAFVENGFMASISEAFMVTPWFGLEAAQTLSYHKSKHPRASPFYFSDFLFGLRFEVPWRIFSPYVGMGFDMGYFSGAESVFSYGFLAETGFLIFFIRNLGFILSTKFQWLATSDLNSWYNSTSAGLVGRF